MSKNKAIKNSKDWQFRFFSSFEEADEANAKEMAAIPGEVHLQNVTARIERLYADKLKKPMDKKLKFKE